MNSYSTIAAIATPPGRGGIGIVRVSGPRAILFSESVFRKSRSSSANAGELGSGKQVADFKSRYLYHGHVIDPETDRVVDEVLLTVMRGPNSYTGEDVVEIQAHSNPFVLRDILGLFLKGDIDLAGPGEFTKRAFLNGRLDLTQAEAVMDIIDAKSSASVKAAASQLEGDLGSRITCLRKILMDFLISIEAGIDFPDDVGDILDYHSTAEIIKEDVIPPLETLVRTHDDARFLRDGIKLAIVGSPNAGKSSLMNRLVEQDRSIVTAMPGTTRDFVEENLNLNGMPFVITDTAGIHATDDPVEVIGIKKSFEKIAISDIILFVVDAASQGEPDDSLVEAFADKKIITVYNKIDLSGASATLEKRDGRGKHISEISALTGQGVGELKNLITEVCCGDLSQNMSSVIPNLRHRELMEKAIESLTVVLNGFESEEPLELIAIDLAESVGFLGDLIGLTWEPDILDSIFGNFCIGK